jgi:hypothetical protein
VGGTGVGSTSAGFGAGTTGTNVGAAGSAATGGTVAGATTNNGSNNAAVPASSSKAIPATVFSSFRTTSPSAANVTWSSNGDSWTARYLNGNTWSTSSFSANGTLINTRTEVSLTDANVLPAGITNYRNQNNGVKRIIRIQAPDTADRYELTTADGRTVTLNSDGTVAKM